MARMVSRQPAGRLTLAYRPRVAVARQHASHLRSHISTSPELELTASANNNG
jgi:hypothetical protein